MLVLLALVFLTTVWLRVKIAKHYTEQRKNYEALAEEFASAHEWVSFEIAQVHHKDGEKIWERNKRVILHYDDKNPTIFAEFLAGEEKRLRESCWLNKDKFVEIDHTNLEITQYSNKVFWDDYHSYGTSEFVPDVFSDMYYYLAPMRKNQSAWMLAFIHTGINSQDTALVDGKPYIKFHGKSNPSYSYDTTGKRFQVHDEIDWFVNEKTETLDSVYSVQYLLNHESHEDFISIKNMDFSDKQRYIDSVLDLGNPQYQNYSRHDSKNPPLSRSYSDNKEATDELLNFPIVKLDGGQTSIAGNEGWLLLNFWTITCPPCVAHLKEMGQEKYSLGCCLLESKGVKVLAIEHKSNNVEYIRSIAEKTNTSDIIYYAKGIGGVINIPALGYYYLISPDKRIVYETISLGDYSELLEAKANYEKQPKNK